VPHFASSHKQTTRETPDSPIDLVGCTRWCAQTTSGQNPTHTASFFPLLLPFLPLYSSPSPIPNHHPSIPSIHHPTRSSIQSDHHETPSTFKVQPINLQGESESILTCCRQFTSSLHLEAFISSCLPRQESFLVFLSNCFHNTSGGIRERTPLIQSPWTLTPESRSPSVSSRRRTGATRPRQLLKSG
jgi:hypothetical protein